MPIYIKENYQVKNHKILKKKTLQFYQKLVLQRCNEKGCGWRGGRLETEEVASWLRALAALPEGQNSRLRTCMIQAAHNYL